jgi:transcription initiation factor IIE alpha subunit
MKKILILTITLAFVIGSAFSQTKAGKIDTTQHTTIYTCSMHPDVVSRQPGKCPKCGMKLNLSAKEQMKTNESKSYTCPVHLTISNHNAGKCPKCGRKLNLSPKEQMKVQVMKIYTCPMHPAVALDKDGICPKCGKELIEKEND